MNSVNSLTGLSMFQVKTGRCPCIIPPLVHSPALSKVKSKVKTDCSDFLNRMLHIESKAKDALLAAKVSQAFHANKSRGTCEIYEVGDCVMLTT
ncbi:hypothetical protein GYMLUDRAFT_112292, partial [Collybiopsis luxurians FD-317 M1]